MNSVLGTRSILSFPAPLRPLLAVRLYATQTGLGTTGATPQPRRKTVTPFNDDGKVAWGDLSSKEKVARTTQQTFNFSFIFVGAVLTAGVAYLMYTEVFSPDSKTTHFNQALSQVKNDSRCTKLLGDSSKITAYKQATASRTWGKVSMINSTTKPDQYGTEHMLIQFNVQGPLNNGVVHVHLTKRKVDSEFFYKYLALDVKGHSRIYLENADTSSDSPAKSKTKLFGINWR